MELCLETNEVPYYRTILVTIILIPFMLEIMYSIMIHKIFIEMKPDQYHHST